MALYIKGMRLPNKTFYSGVDNGLVTAEGNFWSNSKEFGYMVRHDAIEVPSHGRLIDADILKEEVQKMQERLWDKLTDADIRIFTPDDIKYKIAEEIEDLIDSAPTVIEAEE